MCLPSEELSKSGEGRGKWPSLEEFGGNVFKEKSGERSQGTFLSDCYGDDPDG